MVAKVGCKSEVLKPEYSDYGNGPGKNGTYQCVVFGYSWQVINIPKNASLASLTWMKNNALHHFGRLSLKSNKNSKIEKKNSKIKIFQKSKIVSKIENCFKNRNFFLKVCQKKQFFHPVFRHMFTAKIHGIKNYGRKIRKQNTSHRRHKPMKFRNPKKFYFS